MLEDFTYETFAAHLHTTFRVDYGGSQPDQFVLVEATQLPAPAGHTAFALVFRGRGDHILPQATYHFEHPELGTFDLFVVPIRHDANGTYYEANFSRIPGGR